MKYLIIGHGQHGKDTAAEYLRDHHGVSFSSSSWIAAPLVREYLEREHDVVYSSLEDCYEDRHSMRAKWHNIIRQINFEDKTTLAKKIYAENDCYVGLRAQDEYEAIVEKFHPAVLWIDASERKPEEGKDSFDIEYDPDTMHWVDNSWSLYSLHNQLDVVMDDIGGEV